MKKILQIVFYKAINDEEMVNQIKANYRFLVDVWNKRGQ